MLNVNRNVAGFTFRASPNHATGIADICLRMRGFSCAAVLGAATASVMAGPEFVETGDAGSLPATAQKVSGSGPLTRISGTIEMGGGTGLGSGDFEDMYLIMITDPAAFTVSMVNPGTPASFDTQLWLFRADGRGLLANDDTSFEESRSTILPVATDGTMQNIPAPGLYYLALSESPNSAESSEGFIFAFKSSTEVSGPDGEGGGAPITGWTPEFEPPDDGFGNSVVNYRMVLTGAAMVPDELCTWIDNRITLTRDQPTYWSAATGLPHGVSPFTVLFPSDPPGMPDPDGSTDRVLRGYVIAFAVNDEGAEIKWNHLAGNATIVHYRDNASWEYNAWGFQSVNPNVVDGGQSGDPGTLNLNGVEYARGFDLLLLNFQAVGSAAFTGPRQVLSNTDLTLNVVSADLRQEALPPITTKANFDIWNQNEIKFSGTDRCITCFDERLLSNYGGIGIANHFLRPNLQTDHGKARIDGLLSPTVCPDSNPADASLLGVAVKLLEFDGGLALAQAGTNLHGMGVQSATIRYDIVGEPPTSQAPNTSPAGQSPKEALALRKEAKDPEGIASPLILVPVQDRVSATEKGSLLIFSKVELRWDAGGALIQDTFLQLTNDAGQAVHVQMYFILGDRP